MNGDPLTARRIGAELAYLALGVPLGVAYLALLAAGLVAGIVLGSFWVGLPLLLAGAGLLWRCVQLERWLANRLLGTGIAPLPPLARDPRAGAWQRVVMRVRGRRFRRATALLALKLPATLVAGAPAAAALALTVALLTLGVEGLAGIDHGYVGPFRLGAALGAALCLLALPAAVVIAALAHAAARPLAALARSLLVTRLDSAAPIRETLAQSLGDRTLSIAYWLPDRGAFVDEHGRPVPIPEPESGRAWTAVDRDGERVAAIIHDASLDASPELVQAAAAAASLALDNERLKADLRARVEELRASRVRIVEAGDSARRRLERDLHDGAQQQLVALAIDLRLLRGRVDSNAEATAMIDRMDEKLTAALAELRELARGIHPAILSDRGLVPAVNALAERAPIAVRCELSITGRLPAPVEAAAYFVIAEALTNVLKYAQATEVVVSAREQDDDIVVEVADDGVGGAEERAGSGLRGLRDRVSALDGTLSVSSPAEMGTLVRARIPCRAAGLVERAMT